MSEDPVLALATMASWGPAFPRIARWTETGLRRIGAHADVVYIDRSPDGPGSDEPRAGGSGRVRRIELGATHARTALPRLARYLHDRRPSTTVATPGTIGCIAMAAGVLSGACVLPWEQTVPSLDRADVPRHLRLAAQACAALYHRAPTVVAVSGGVRDALVGPLPHRLDPERVVVVPNPVDADEIVRLAGAPVPRPVRMRLCAVGRLVSAKGFDVLVEALARADLGAAWELVIVGDGPLRNGVEQAVARHRLGAQVRLVGHLANPYPLVASADIVVQPSRWEGFGIAVLEALALGRPVIATSCPGGVAEILGGGRFGVLVPPGDADALAGGLRRLADDRRLRELLAELGPGRAADFSPVRVAGQLVDLARRGPHGAGRPPAPAPVR